MDVYVALCLLLCFTQLEAGSTNKQCYKAKTCIHNNHEKCGLSSNGTLRRFLDSCDIFEFNCLKHADFKKAPMTNCQHLESLYEPEAHNKDEEDNQIGQENQEAKLGVGLDGNGQGDYPQDGTGQGDYPQGGIGQEDYPQDGTEQGNISQGNIGQENGAETVKSVADQAEFRPSPMNLIATFQPNK